MSAVGLSALAWLLTYLVHSTVFLGGTWALCAAVKRLPPAWQDRLWKLALVGGLATASAQAGLGLEPIGGRVLLARGAPDGSVDGGGSAQVLAPAASELPVDGGGARSERDARSARLLSVHGPAARRAAADRADAQPPSDAGDAGDASDASDADAAERADDGRADARSPARISAHDVARWWSLCWVQDALAAPGARAGADDVAAIPASAQAEPPPSLAAPAPAPARDVLEEDLEPVAAGVVREPAAALLADRLPRAWILAAGAAWAAAAAAGLLAFLRAHRRLRAQIGDRIPLDSGPLRERLDELARRAGVRGRVRLTASARVPAPITHGVLRREICVPARALTDLSPRQQDALLGHELGHAVRRDPAWLGLCWLLERVLLVQPLNRVARARLSETAELCCDDWAVHLTGRRLSLASCLTEVAQWVVGAPPPRGLVAAGMAARGASLTRRVERLLAAPPRPAARPTRWWPAGALAAIALVAGGAPGFAAALREPTRPAAAPAAAAPATSAVARAEAAALPGPADAAPRRSGAATARVARPGAGRPVRSVPADGREGLSPEAASAALLAELDRELALAEAELRDLLREVAGRGDVARLSERLRAIQDGLAGLRARRTTLGSLLPLALAPDDPAAGGDPAPSPLSR